MIVDPYDELPYKCLPIEWTAPERLALASQLHGGPCPPLDGYRVLELGCGNGANLLPQAFYRRHGTFVGVDGARSQIDAANAARSELGLSNVDFVHSDFRYANGQLLGQFDYIIAHGIFSWVSDQVRDALLQLCAERLHPGGLLYLNYNANPGWKVRGLVREFLLAQTEGEGGLAARARSAQDVAARILSSLPAGDHPYTNLIANEFRFVCENDVSYVAHEYLAEDNHAYWRSDFLGLCRARELEFVADADFNYSTGRVPEDVAPRLVATQVTGRTLDDTVDLLCYRQLHSPILARSPLKRRQLKPNEFESLFIASCLSPCAPSDSGCPMFEHPSGYRVEAKEEIVRSALEKLKMLWPRGLRVGDVLPDVGRLIDDVRLLHRNGLIELRCFEPPDLDIGLEPLRRLESLRGNYFTTAYHTREAACV